MTKKSEILKLATVAVMATGLLAGCATDGSSEAGETMTTTETAKQETMKKGPNAAAKNAIYAAKVRNGRAKKAGYEWRDTGKLIKAAEKAAAKGDNDKAVALAQQAKDQASAAIAQAASEAARFEKNHGTSTMASAMANSGSMMASTDSNDYTVITGDSLWNISAKNSVYGNPYQWPLIFKANAAKIQDADLIFSGQVFSIPAATSSETSAAVQHAKTRGAWSIGEAEKSDLNYILGFK